MIASTWTPLVTPSTEQKEAPIVTASRLLQLGFTQAALMQARYAMERHLKALAQSYGITKLHGQASNAFATKLFRAGHIGPVEYREVKLMLRTLNLAAHGGDVNRTTANFVVNQVAEWLNLHKPRHESRLIIAG